MIRESLKDARKASELIRACEEQMRQVISQWQAQPHGSPWLVGLPQQQSLIVDLLTAIEQGSEAALQSWAELAHARRFPSEQFVSNVRRLAGRPIREMIELGWNEATCDGMIVPCDTLPLGMKPDPRDAPMYRTGAVPDGALFAEEYDAWARAEEIQDYLDDLLPAMKRQAGDLMETLAAKAFEATGSRAEPEQSPAASAGHETEAMQQLGADALDESERTSEAGGSPGSSHESEQLSGSGRENGSSATPTSLPWADPFDTPELRLALVEAAAKAFGSKRQLAKKIPVQPKHLYAWIKEKKVKTKRRSSVPTRIENWLKKNYLKETRQC
jgi:hypothetical protein